MMNGGTRLVALLILLALAIPTGAAAQSRIKDLVIADATVPVRLVGYGLVTGLDGTGDLSIGGRSGGQTVQSVVNLLRRFDIEVPPAMLRTRNVAAVLVTAEVSPFLRPGGRFEVQVSSLGDARSLRGGVLWMTPLQPDVGADPVATAQGPVLLSDGDDDRNGRLVATAARIPQGGLLEQALPRPAVVASNTLLLREPDLATATRIAAAIDGAFGAGVARVDDPGAVTLALPANAEGGPAVALARIGELMVTPDRAARIVVDVRDGTVVAGGDMTVGPAVVSHAGITLTIVPANGGMATEADPRDLRGEVRVPAGASVQQVAAALHAAQSTPREIAAIFASLREVGALSAEVVVR
ncbi:MAG TPA: flagellar basal body P-ring protein FlgI [Gemmatimonadales bacterium]